MFRFACIAVLAAPVFGNRVGVVTADHVAKRAERSESAARRDVLARVSLGHEVLSMLKADMENEDLQKEYRELNGGLEWGENKIFLTTGVQMEQAPVALGPMSHGGQVMNVAERIDTGDRSAIGGRLLTRRHDYVVEPQGGNSKYVLDGVTMSMHGRMFVKDAGSAEPRFILRRAYNYLNPIAGVFGQYAYRVIQCTEPAEGSCTEGDILYTITKDTSLRGNWVQDEYRVHTGTGGCAVGWHGVLNCDSSSQIFYSVGTPSEDGHTQTDVFRTSGDETDESLKVAHTTKVTGPARSLRWAEGMLLGPVFGVGTEVVNEITWADTYSVTFEGAGGPVDELLICLLAAVQDLTRDRVDAQSITGGVSGLRTEMNAASSAYGGASTSDSIEAR